MSTSPSWLARVAGPRPGAGATHTIPKVGPAAGLERFLFQWKQKPFQHLTLSHFRTENRIPLFLKML
jgi:hypothetical protein